ncbi:IS701 family transposase [Mesorhizobium sp. M0960]|uniref:IS701 family transposase n=1 Tax=Mesorhizobium sp. M0960 TaxID=2957035 RepID=UPI003334E6C3
MWAAGEDCDNQAFRLGPDGCGPATETRDRARCARASIPEMVEFATKPKMARAMVEAALDAGVPCAYVLGDAVYGADSSLRRMLEAREQPYVLAVRGAHFMRRGGDRLFEETSPEELASEFEPDDWACHAAGEGAKGPRLYDWARIRRPWTSKGGFEHWLLVRRKQSTSGEKAYYLVFAPPGSSLAELAAVAGLRWAIEECFERAKDDLGLDHCEARSWHGWHRHMSLCMAALAFLSKLSVDLRRSAWSKPNETSPKSQSPPDPNGCARPERPRDPLSPRPDPHLPTDTKALHHRLVAMATTTSGRGHHLSLQTASTSATVVLDQSLFFGLDHASSAIAEFLSSRERLLQPSRPKHQRQPPSS